MFFLMLLRRWCFLCVYVLRRWEFSGIVENGCVFLSPDVVEKVVVFRGLCGQVL